ncbi:hypothetical protein EDD37DRAFT_646683 [Exophiala viscosa]|uniref:uncharacterized protein n=1 Tax=Exophiala viscosa TaxID=2486360 RepID=UPI0021914F77|nr:hypothetical protein EDD37DRAFT_646683 [Exophiala viscosa]
MVSNITIVVGASRGIGVELAKHLAQTPGTHVVATMHKGFSLELPNVEVIQLDQSKTDSVHAAARKVKEADTLIVNGAIGEDELLTAHRVVNAFLPPLRVGNTRRIIYISSTAASLTKQVGEPWGLHGPYADSKTAGNMLTVQYHKELHDDGFKVVFIHPGWVATDMGNLAGPGAMPVTESVQKIMEIVNGLSRTDGAKFFDMDGTTLPW